eukprot:7287659-Alexandrium_andersonii.AAC.1
MDQSEREAKARATSAAGPSKKRKVGPAAVQEAIATRSTQIATFSSSTERSAWDWVGSDDKAKWPEAVPPYIVSGLTWANDLLTAATGAELSE